MLRELTLSVDETLYNTLIPMVEKQTIGNLLAEFVQVRSAGHTYTQEDLETGYRQWQLMKNMNGKPWNGVMDL